MPVPGLGFNDAIELTPDGILDDVQVVPWLYAVDAYGSMVKALQDDGQAHSTIVPLSYDWRGDLMHAVRKLDETIRHLRTEGTTDIRIVAHSMGGMLPPIIFATERRSPIVPEKRGKAPDKSIGRCWPAFPLKEQ